MQAERLQLGLRARTAMESLDLGVRLAQQQWPALLRVYGPVALLVGLGCFATHWLWQWLPTLLLWLLRPWLDALLLQVFSRAVFGLPSAWSQVWPGAQWGRLSLWPARLWSSLSPWRSFTQPVVQLEGLRGKPANQRRQRLLHGQRWRAAMAQFSWMLLELWLTFSLLWLVLWLNPFEQVPNVFRWLDEEAGSLWLTGLQLLCGLVLEVPFVAGGFAMYLNRRVELESWDVEQELRHAFPG